MLYAEQENSMKLFNLSGVALVMGVMVTGCGSSQAPVIGSGTGYNNPYYNPSNGNQTGYNTYSVPGGTKQIIPVVSGSAYSGSDKVIQQAVSVAVNDQINVYAMGAMVTGRGSLGYNQGQLTSFTVSLNGAVLGNSPTGQYTAQTAGTLGLSFGWNALIGSGWTYSTFQVDFPMNGGIWIGRCTNTSGQSMVCPPGY